MRIALLLMAMLWSVNFTIAGDLDLLRGDQLKSLSFAELREGATEQSEGFDPFRKRNVVYRGYNFNAFLQREFGGLVDHIRVTAQDGYQIELKSLTRSDWVLVTHEDGEPLSIRSHGPLRLVQTDLQGRDPHNMSLYDDWIWMIRRIEVLD